METEFAAKELCSDLPALHMNYLSIYILDLVGVVCGSDFFYLYGEKEWGKYFWNQAAKKVFCSAFTLFPLFVE